MLAECHGNVEMGEHSRSLNWSLKVLQVIMLLLAIGISVRMLNSRRRKGV